jgi:hypothetical protein
VGGRAGRRPGRGARGGWKFANVKDGNLAEYFHVNVADKVVRGATKPILVCQPVDKSAPAE